MTHKERILRTITGRETDFLPFVPRLDLWYRSNKTNRTLPEKYKTATLMEITEDLDIGYHAVVPDFKDVTCPEDEIYRALGIHRLRQMPYRVETDSIEKKVTYDKDVTTVVYSTPYGDIRTRVLYDDTMKKAGISISHILEYAIKSISDFEAAAYIFRNLKVKPNYKEYDEFRDMIGDRGIAVAFTSLAASPMHLIQRELMPMDTFFFEQFDHPSELETLAEAIKEHFMDVFDIVCGSSAEIIFSGANYDRSITYPPYFEKHIMPYLAKQSELLHAKGKLLLTHTDGENKGLLELYLRSGIDIADSICPYPMTSHTLRDVRDVFGEKITVWGGIPSVSVLKSSMSDLEFERYLNGMLENAGNGDHLIAAIADTTPPAADFTRILKINKACRSFGRIKPTR